MLISIAVFGYWGYRAELFPNLGGEALGVVLGLVVAILVTPIVFFLLMVFTHCMIKLEDFFQGEDIQSQQQSQDKWPGILREEPELGREGSDQRRRFNHDSFEFHEC